MEPPQTVLRNPQGEELPSLYRDSEITAVKACLVLGRKKLRALLLDSPWVQPFLCILPSPQGCAIKKSDLL